MGEIVVTARKREENMQSVPASIAALSADQLGRAQVNLAVDLPKITSNLSVYTGTGYSSPFIRGVGVAVANAGLEGPIAVYLDDVYLSRASDAMFNFSDIERIEVLRGPQGTLYGRNATGGAIKIITKDPNHTLISTSKQDMGVSTV